MQTADFNKEFNDLIVKNAVLDAKQPNTVPVQWPNIVAANATPYVGNMWGQTSFWN